MKLNFNGSNYTVPQPNAARTTGGRGINRNISLKSSSFKATNQSVHQQYADQRNDVANFSVQNNVDKPIHRTAQAHNMAQHNDYPYLKNHGAPLPSYEQVASHSYTATPQSAPQGNAPVAHFYTPTQIPTPVVFAHSTGYTTQNYRNEQNVPINANHPNYNSNAQHFGTQQNSPQKVGDMNFSHTTVPAMAIPCEQANITQKSLPSQCSPVNHVNAGAAPQMPTPSAPEELYSNQHPVNNQPPQQLVPVQNKSIVISGLLALNALLTKFMNDIYAPIEPNDIVNNTMLVLGEHQELYTHDGCAIVGSITTSLLNTRDAYVTACREVYEWTSLVVPLLKGFLRLVENGKSSSLTARVTLLDKVATQAIAKMNLVITNLDACVHYLKQTLVNLKQLHYELRDIQNPTEPECNWGEPISPSKDQNISGNHENMYPPQSKQGSTISTQNRQGISTAEPNCGPMQQELDNDDRPEYLFGAPHPNATTYQKNPIESLAKTNNNSLSQHIAQRNPAPNQMHLSAFRDFDKQERRIESLGMHFFTGINEISEYVKTLSELGSSLKQTHTVNPLNGVSEIELIPAVNDLMQVCTAYNKK
ncbi:hypothetical protein THRCLA_03759 [Thraustotheca clavata]|uniref:Uncharacterized protein n=1 Tax=Thraustotheca clavata TaxID=74557 RepID=A0A1W0A186_9STRA|nr:hypothetical protein THRCLA_03759 [Thraustotheca clavata]